MNQYFWKSLFNVVALIVASHLLVTHASTDLFMWSLFLIFAIPTFPILTLGSRCLDKTKAKHNAITVSTSLSGLDAHWGRTRETARASLIGLGTLFGIPGILLIATWVSAGQIGFPRLSCLMALCLSGIWAGLCLHWSKEIRALLSLHYRVTLDVRGSQVTLTHNHCGGRTRPAFPIPH